MKNNSAFLPKREPPVDLRQVRAAFILRGDSLYGWVKTQGFQIGYVDQALRGVRRGPKAQHIVSVVKKEIGL
jgi:hypothetical protein